MQLLQNLSRELARSSGNQPKLVDLVEMLERIKRGEKLKLTLDEKKLLFVARHSLTTVYFIAAVDAGKIKIGKTVDLKKRLASLSTMSPVDVTLVCSVDYDDGLEGRIHRHLSEYRSHGEWFHADPFVLDFIRGYRDGGIRWLVEQVGESGEYWMNSRGIMPEDMRAEMYFPGDDPDYPPNTQNKSGIDHS